MTCREIITEAAGGMCFMALLYLLFMACYVAAPYQPSQYSEKSSYWGEQ